MQASTRGAPASKLSLLSVRILTFTGHAGDSGVHIKPEAFTAIGMRIVVYSNVKLAYDCNLQSALVEFSKSRFHLVIPFKSTNCAIPILVESSPLDLVTKRPADN